MDRLRIFTWHVHGTYLYYLSQGRYTIYLPINRSGSDGYIGRGTTFPFGKNVLEVPVGDVRDMQFDCILFQNAKTYLHDQYQVLSEEQRKLPKIFLEHDPPLEHATDTLHVASDPSVTLVHVTHYNKLMWDSLRNPGRVIEHGIPSTTVPYKGDL